VALRNAMAAGNINISGQGMIEHISSFLSRIDRDLNRGCCDAGSETMELPEESKAAMARQVQCSSLQHHMLSSCA